MQMKYDGILILEKKDDVVTVNEDLNWTGNNILLRNSSLCFYRDLKAIELTEKDGKAVIKRADMSGGGMCLHVADNSCIMLHNGDKVYGKGLEEKITFITDEGNEIKFSSVLAILVAFEINTEEMIYKYDREGLRMTIQHFRPVKNNNYYYDLRL